MTAWVWKSNNSIKKSFTLAGGPLNFEALGFSLSNLKVNPALSGMVYQLYLCLIENLQCLNNVIY
jgi:hypothetical protein